ncbi:MAG: VanZ family protein [Balneolaceae bacterium]
MIGKSIAFLAGKKYIVYSLFAAITLATLMLTLLPPDNLQNEKLFQYDKLGHFLMFFGWSFMFGFSLIINGKKKSPLVLIFIAGTLFGLSIEFLQELLPYGRTASLGDAAADAAGSFFAVLLLWWMKSHYKNHLSLSNGKNTI